MSDADSLPLPAPYLSADAAALLLGENVREPLYTVAQLRAYGQQERDRCAAKLNVSRADVSLAAGEMTAQEWQTCAAVLRWMQDRIRSA